MFCPVCKSEYRRGFTHCSDCGAGLVENLTAASAGSNAPGDADAGEVLWTGTDASASGAISDALEAAGIPRHVVTHDVGPLPGLAMPVYAILVRAGDRAAAQAVLEDVRSQFETSQRYAEGAAASNSAQSQPTHFAVDNPRNADDADDASPLPPDYVPADFDPDDATREVWSGNDSAMAQTLKDCLRENGIGCAISESAPASRVAVLPADESRAREIIREVVEATPPDGPA